MNGNMQDIFIKWSFHTLNEWINEWMNETLLFQNGIFDQLKTQFFTFTYSNTLYVKVCKREK